MDFCFFTFIRFLCGVIIHDLSSLVTVGVHLKELPLLVLTGWFQVGKDLSKEWSEIRRVLADGPMDGLTAEVFKGTGLLQASAGAWPAAIITTDFCMLIFLLATLLNSSVRYYRFFIVDFFWMWNFWDFVHI